MNVLSFNFYVILLVMCLAVCVFICGFLLLLFLRRGFGVDCV